MRDTNRDDLLTRMPKIFLPQRVKPHVPSGRWGFTRWGALGKPQLYFEYVTLNEVPLDVSVVELGVNVPLGA